MEAERRTGVDDMSAEADELVACVRMETGLCHRHVYIVQPSTGRWKEVAHIHCSRRSRRSRRRRRSGGATGVPLGVRRVVEQQQLVEFAAGEGQPQ